jgi:hypothetical protein
MGLTILQDSTAVMILAEENVVLEKANAELFAQIQDLNGRQRKQTEILGGHSTVLNDALTSGQALLELLELSGTYSRLIGELRESIANDKGELSILAPTTHPCDAKRLHRFDQTTVKSPVRTRSQRR